MRDELLKGLTEEQIAKVKACKTMEETLMVAKEEGITSAIHSSKPSVAAIAMPARLRFALSAVPPISVRHIAIATPAERDIGAIIANANLSM